MSTAIIILVNVALDAVIVTALAYVCTRAARLTANGRDVVANGRELRSTTTPSRTPRQPAAAQWRLRGQSADARV